MNLFKKQKNTTNDISHVLINKKKRKFPEPIITIRQIEERDVDEVRQLLHDHFNSLTLPAVVYWSIQHIYDLLVIIAINYIFFLDIRKIFYFLGIFVIYLYIRAKLEFLRHIRKDCPDLDNLYQSYVKVDGCNFWVAEVFDSNSDSVSRTTCSDIYEREKVICDQEKEEPLKAINNETGNGSVGDVNFADEETMKNEKKDKTNTENDVEAIGKLVQDEVGEHKNKEYENEELKFHEEGKFGEKNDYNVESKTKEEKEEKKDENRTDTFEAEKHYRNSENTEDAVNKNENEEIEESETKKCYKKVNIDLFENKIDASKNKSSNDIIEEMRSNKNIDGNSYTLLYYEKENKGEVNKQETTKETFCGLTEYKEGESKTQNIGETTYLNTDCINSNNNGSCCSGDRNKNNKSGRNDEKDKDNDTTTIITTTNNSNNTNTNNDTTTIITTINNSNNTNNNYGNINSINTSNNNNVIARIKDDEDYNIKCMNRKIVGCVGIVPYKGDSSIAQLVRMVVKKDNRRMRIGSRLLTQLENFAYEQNYKELKVFTNNLNTDSLYFVKQHGFSLSQIVRRGLMRGDLLIWSKILNKDEFYKFNSTDVQSYTTNILD